MWEQIISAMVVIVPTLATQWFISRRQRIKIEESNQLQQAKIEEGIQRRHDENQATMQTWQDHQVKQERLWRLEAETERFKEQRACDERIDQTRAQADQKIEALRAKYDTLHDTYVGLLQEKAQLRVEVHDLRNALATFQDSLKVGGQRRYDPPQGSIT